MSRFAGWEEDGLRTVKFLEKISEKFVAKRSPRGARHKKPLRLSRYPSTLASIVPIPAQYSRLSRSAHNRSNPGHIRLEAFAAVLRSCVRYYVTDRFVRERTLSFPFSFLAAEQCGNPIREGRMDGWNARTVPARVDARLLPLTPSSLGR